jgi:uncharacterized membrane protein
MNRPLLILLATLIGAIIIAPICYAILGFIGGLIGAVVYNFAAGMIGGIEVETA